MLVVVVRRARRRTGHRRLLALAARDRRGGACLPAAAAAASSGSPTGSPSVPRPRRTRRWPTSAAGSATAPTPRRCCRPWPRPRARAVNAPPGRRGPPRRRRARPDGHLAADGRATGLTPSSWRYRSLDRGGAARQHRRRDAGRAPTASPGAAAARRPGRPGRPGLPQRPADRRARGQVEQLSQRTSELAESRRAAHQRRRRRTQPTRTGHRPTGRAAPAARSRTACASSPIAPDAATTPGRHGRSTLLVASLNSALEALREITRGVFPAQLARSGLPTALGSLLTRTAGTHRLAVEDSASGRRFDPRVEAAAYFCAAEAVRDLGGPGRRVLSVEDDGYGWSSLARGRGASAQPHPRPGRGDRRDRVDARRRAAGSALDAWLPLDSPSALRSCPDRAKPIRSERRLGDVRRCAGLGDELLAGVLVVGREQQHHAAGWSRRPDVGWPPARRCRAG